MELHGSVSLAVGDGGKESVCDERRSTASMLVVGGEDCLGRLGDNCWWGWSPLDEGLEGAPKIRRARRLTD